MRLRFSDWVADVRDIMITEGVAMDIDSADAKEYWKDGSSPEDYFDSLISASSGDDDFDPRYDM